MSDTGFRIHGLRVTNASLPAADAGFGKPLTVVAGASDTGKTYMMQCINWLLGASPKRRPKDIEASRGYTVGLLEILPASGDVFTLQRALSGGDFLKYATRRDDLSTDDEPIRLGATHRAQKDDTVSQLFLGLCGLDGRFVRTNKSGKTRTLSFRDVAHLFCIDEERILSSTSPVVSGQVVSGTVEESVFRMLVTGEDDSAFISEPDAKSTAGTEAKTRLLDELIEQAHLDIEDITADPSAVEKELIEVGEAIDSLSAAIADNRSLVRDVQERRQQAWKTIQKCRSRHIAISELLDRLELLSQQYATDRNRLETVLEANYFFAQMAEETCPLCGSYPGERSKNVGSAYEPEGLREACEDEIRKIDLLVADLSQTREQLTRETDSLASRVTELGDKYEAASTQLADELRPTTTLRQRRLQEVLSRRQRLERAVSLLEQIQALEQKKQVLASPRDGAGGAGLQRGISAAQAYGFCKHVQQLLKTWGFPTGGVVTWSEEKQDIVIDGSDRASHGKGLRAISHAAFAVGLMRHCKSKRLPHPGIVILDSPLVTYRQPDTPPNQKVAPGLKDAFYRSLASGEGEQIIVLENEDPPEDLRSAIGYIHFSKSPGVGRYGFFPNRADET